MTNGPRHHKSVTFQRASLSIDTANTTPAFEGAWLDSIPTMDHKKPSRSACFYAAPPGETNHL
eukprot:6256491-Amphidinium_carterae.1